VKIKNKKYTGRDGPVILEAVRVCAFYAGRRKTRRGPGKKDFWKTINKNSSFVVFFFQRLQVGFIFT